ncbi:MAG TPA: alpha/beta fold hydrolase, partial [Aggregatilineales bacterium]|nr:alpha/beta fold hydrolase [Aggregatilineales bacterium]
DEWNLYGISYGTRLALTAMRDFPTGIRSVILDSSYPPQQDLYATIAPNFERSLRRLFDDCAESAACSEAYPDLETVFYDTIVQLDSSPVTVTATLPSTGQDFDLLINGNFLTGFLFEALYQSNVLPSLPQMIYAAQQQDFALMTIIHMAIMDQSDSVAFGMQLSVQCSEEVPFSDPDAAAQNAAANPLLEEFIVSHLNLGKGIFAICNTWIHNDTPSIIENEPVMSSIPTLVMAGEYDPITPPEWGREVASTLENSYFFEYPGTGHGASVAGECPLNMALDFLDDPTIPPDARCMANMGAPEFAIVRTSINLVEFTDDSLNVSGVRPEDWEPIAPGTFGRSAIGEVAISQIALPGISAETTASLVMSQIPDTVLPEPSASYSSSRYEWTIYELEYQGLVIHIAVSEDADGAYLVMLQAPPTEITGLYDSVLIPALDAFTTINP